MEQKNKASGAYNIKLTWITYLPIILLLAVVPFIVRMSVNEVSPEVARIFKTQQIVDFFSSYKAMIIMTLAGVMVLGFFLIFQKQKIKKDKTMIFYYVGAALFGVFSLLSTLFSEYNQVAVWGVPDRCEGMVMIASYIIMLLYTIYIVDDIKDYKYIIYPLCVLVIGTGFLGVFQYFGHDLILNENLGLKLIVPKEYMQYAGNIGVDYEKGKVYGTMFHYNYMGSFGAMMVPLFATLALFLQGKKKKLIFGIMTIISLFILFGSTSRAGLVGLVITGVVFIIIFSKKIIKGYKIVLPVLLGLIVVLFGFNAATGGTIFERIPTLVNDMFALTTGGNKDFDYRDQLPLRDIKNENGMVTFVTQEDSLTLDVKENRLLFLDKQVKPVEYTLENNMMQTKDPRFANLSFEIVSAEAGKVPSAIKVGINNQALFAVRTNEAQEIYLADSFTGEKLDLVYPETIGFKGKEKIGSSRGYIWSRSLPLAKDTLLLGNGPDTYALKFPQKDLLGKYYAYDTPNMTVDKPHNLYLQILLNNGGVALLGFLILVITYLIQSLRLYTFKAYYTLEETLGAGITLAIVGYLGAGIFNDSIVSVAPIFWILLGVGIAINYLINKERVRLTKTAEHATINMKNKKHI